MGKAFGMLLMLVALWVGLTLYSEGTQSAFGGAFASVASAGVGRDGADPAGAAAGRAPLTERVRSRVAADLEAAAERHGGDLE